MTKDELQKFCAKEDDPRCHIWKPWSVGDYSYATNGYACVRVPRLADVDEIEKPVNAEKLFEEAAKYAAEYEIEWIPVPTLAMPEMLECSRCHGSGFRECDMGHEHECDHCDEGKIVDKRGIDVGDSHYQARFLAMFQGWSISTRGQKASGLLKLGAMRALIMPMRKE